MDPIQALSILERAVRAMALSADEHDKLREAVKAIFEKLKGGQAVEEPAKPA